MRKEKETTVCGKKIRITQLGFEDGMDLLVLLYKTLGPSIGAFLSKLEKQDAQNIGDANVSMSAIAQGLTELAQRLNAQDFKHVINTLAKSTRINREADKWPVLEPQVDLAGEFGFLFAWLRFAFEVRRFFRRQRPVARQRHQHDEDLNVKVGSHIRWEIHRIVTSGYYHVSSIEVQREWSIDDVFDAHEVLDAFEKLQRLEQRRWQR